ncbi:ethylene-responsive transcription factor ERF017 [Brachypodium distachyon]|uniref:AP2/ERF domain-containing protein n=1 Tax=Brachypodium distachyon TaxID=15368 RepID=I1I7M0_BRADI|nr:ethylene-responsive transcription factor ERF017 [Brachypodium distachyon]KQJ98545.1 hypothetical protein BRADI_3g37544v3 [Brachypodium distachyon]|eukprot:XP_010236718.1 ethylene-responsive transcription factor ERF017 [Brachypodium distachyon]
MDAAGASRGEGSERRYKGVRLRKWGRWVSEIRMPNSRERIWLGSYESAEKAALAFDAAAVCLRGSRAGSLNFPECPPDVQYIPGSLPTPERIQAVAARHANSACPAPAARVVAASSNAGAASQEAPATARTSTSVDATGCDDMLDYWSFMDELPSSMPASSSTSAANADIVIPAMDDFMYGFSPPPRPAGEAAEDVIDDHGDDGHTFLSALWKF